MIGRPCDRKEQYVKKIRNLVIGGIENKVFNLILATVFLKQHSVIDVALGIVMSVVLQLICDRIFETEEERVLALQASYGTTSRRSRTE